jgi:hypothetical protein
MNDLKPGDVVSLAGTRMKMTVERLEERLVGEGEVATCLWFDRDNQLNKYPFPVEILESTDD